MFRRALNLAMMILSVAMTLFVAGYLSDRLGAQLVGGFCYNLAGKLTLSGFGIFMLMAATGATLSVYRDIKGFFAKENRGLRQIWSVRSQQLYQLQINRLRQRQLAYLNQARRQKLSARDDRKQLKALYDAINGELQSMKQQISAETYAHCRKALQKHFKKADAEAMLAVQKQFLCR